MAIRPLKHNFQGFTLIEMVVIVGIIGIIAGFAVPSFLTWQKPLRDGASQFKSHLSLIRSKAISSRQAYRISPMSVNRADYKDSIPRNFVVDYAANCAVTTGWKRASQFDLDLPEKVGITDVSSTTLLIPGSTSVAVSNDLNWNGGQGFCFDNRGIASTTLRFAIKDFQNFNTAQIALFDISLVGGIDVYLYNKDNIVVNSY